MSRSPFGGRFTDSKLQHKWTRRSCPPVLWTRQRVCLALNACVPALQGSRTALCLLTASGDKVTLGRSNWSSSVAARWRSPWTFLQASSLSILFGFRPKTSFRRIKGPELEVKRVFFPVCTITIDNTERKIHVIPSRTRAVQFIHCNIQRCDDLQLVNRWISVFTYRKDAELLHRS